MKIVCVTAHPDDLEIAAGGTLLDLKYQGHEIVSVITVRPSLEDNPNRSEDIVLQELEQSYTLSKFDLRVLDTDLHTNGRPNLRCDNNTMRKLGELIDYCDIAILPNPQDSHQDHRTTYDLAWPIVQKRARQVWLMESWPYCYHYKTNTANLYRAIDVAPKEQLLSCYSSYLTPYNIEQIQNLNRVWGDRSGASMAEAFTMVYKYE